MKRKKQMQNFLMYSQTRQIMPCTYIIVYSRCCSRQSSTMRSIQFGELELRAIYQWIEWENRQRNYRGKQRYIELNGALNLILWTFMGGAPSVGSQNTHTSTQHLQWFRVIFEKEHGRWLHHKSLLNTCGNYILYKTNNPPSILSVFHKKLLETAIITSRKGPLRQQTAL